ncbi:MAG: hypothetical protein H0U57_01470 [Tatlockia sp.]|nr:hypothetical protein [Tatlockia sp.]
MSLFDSSGEKVFQAALQKEASFLNNSYLDRDAKKLRDITVEKGKNFLKSVRELKKLTHTNTHKFYDDFLQAAATALISRTNTNWDSLSRYYITFKKNIEDSETSHRAVGGWNIFSNSLRLTAGIGGMAMGGMAIHVAIWSTATLAMGPWGIAALGVAIALVGLIVAICELYNLYQNTRLCRDKQVEEITAFIRDLDPHEDVAHIRQVENQPPSREDGPELYYNEENPTPVKLGT